MSFTPPWDDLNEFLGDFSTTAIITPKGKQPRSVEVIFDDPYLNADIGEYDADSSKPRITGKESDLCGMVRTDPVEVNGKLYHSLDAPEIDGTGMATLHIALEG